MCSCCAFGFLGGDGGGDWFFHVTSFSMLLQPACLFTLLVCSVFFWLRADLCLVLEGPRECSVTGGTRGVSVPGVNRRWRRGVMEEVL